MHNYVHKCIMLEPTIVSEWLFTSVQNSSLQKGSVVTINSRPVLINEPVAIKGCTPVLMKKAKSSVLSIF